MAGIEAGTWMDPWKDYHADEIFNNVPGQVGDQIALPSNRTLTGGMAVRAVVQ